MSRQQVAALELRLSEAEETLRAIRNGEVDAVVVGGRDGDQVFTLDGAEHAYRVLVESMNEGALTLTEDSTILYANRCFARMIRSPLEQVTGNSFRRFVGADDNAAYQRALECAKEGSKVQILLQSADGSKLPAQLSFRVLLKSGSSDAAFAMVVSDRAESKHAEEMLRALTNRVVQTQETERSRVACDLHDRITQLLCALAMQSHVLVATLPGPLATTARKGAMKLRDRLSQVAEEVERISRDLRPSVLVELGLAAMVTQACSEFANRTGISVKVSCEPVGTRLTSMVELSLYRILQEALKNARTHARARHVLVSLSNQSGFAELIVNDDGVGF